MSMPLSVWTVAAKLAEEDTEFDPNIVSPGVAGFLVTGLFALLVIGLGFLLVRKLRRNQYRHDAREQIALELAERDAAAGAAGAAGAASTAGSEGAPGASAEGPDGPEDPGSPERPGNPATPQQ